MRIGDVTPPRHLWTALLVMFGLSPLLALLTAKMYSMVWDILLAPQFGHGPSYQSWYGITVIVTLMMHGGRDKGEVKESESMVFFALRRAFSYYLLGGLMILIAMFVRRMLGWP